MLSHKGQRLASLAALDGPCQGDCCNHVLSRDTNGTPAPYVYGVTGDPGGPYRWPVDDNKYARVSALTFQGQPFTLPFNDIAVVHWGTWMYSAPPGNWHHAIDYLRPNDWQTFEVRAAAPGKVVHAGWDNWSANTIIVSHDVGGVTDAFRTIYMHLRNGPIHDIDASWNQTVPTLSGAGLTNYKTYLAAIGGAQDPASRTRTSITGEPMHKPSRPACRAGSWPPAITSRGRAAPDPAVADARADFRAIPTRICTSSSRTAIRRIATGTSSIRTACAPTLRQATRRA